MSRVRESERESERERREGKRRRKKTGRTGNKRFGGAGGVRGLAELSIAQIKHNKEQVYRVLANAINGNL